VYYSAHYIWHNLPHFTNSIPPQVTANQNQCNRSPESPKRLGR